MAAFRYFRLNITSWAAGGAPGTSGETRVSELQLFDASDVKYPASNMTGNSAPSPLVASASSSFGGGFEAHKAFDGIASDSNRWISSGAGAQWVQIDLGDGNAIDISKIKIAPDSAVTSGYYIVAFHLAGSNTGLFSGEEVGLISESGLTSGWANNTLRTFEVPIRYSGVITDAAGEPAARVVRLYRRDTGVLLASASSDGVTGAYELLTVTKMARSNVSCWTTTGARSTTT